MVVKKIEEQAHDNKTIETEFEVSKGLVSRTELREHILGLFDELNEQDFHALYEILWSLTAKGLIIKLDDVNSNAAKKVKRKRLRKELTYLGWKA